MDERQPQYLFVDSLKPSEIIFCMSALCRWNEPPPPPPSHSAQGLKSGGKERSDEAASVTDAGRLIQIAPVFIDDNIDFSSRTGLINSNCIIMQILLKSVEYHALD